MNEMPYVSRNEKQATSDKGIVYKYGEFFPPEFSPFAYNETVAQEYLPLSKEEALEQGFIWQENEKKPYQPTIHAKDLPDSVEDVPAGILRETIRCLHEEECNDLCYGAFRLIPRELKFYKTMKLSLPRLCPNCRHAERLAERNPMKFLRRNCMCRGNSSDGGFYKNQSVHFHGSSRCPNEFETSYAPDRPEVVYCETCYQQEVI